MPVEESKQPEISTIAEAPVVAEISKQPETSITVIAETPVVIAAPVVENKTENSEKPEVIEEPVAIEAPIIVLPIVKVEHAVEKVVVAPIEVPVVRAPAVEKVDVPIAEKKTEIVTAPVQTSEPPATTKDKKKCIIM